MDRAKTTSALIASTIVLLFIPQNSQAANPSAEALRANHFAVTPPPWNRVGTDASVEGRIDPLIFFDELVARYRGLTAYRDSTHIVQITRRYDDTEPQRTETRVECELTDGKLSVVTPGSQVRHGLGLRIPVRESAETQQAQMRYDLWLLPHMALKFSERPLEELREGVPEGFTATEAVTVTIANRQMVHLELTSGDGLSGDYNARFDLYVDPESMLIERIEGRQRLPDGGDFETTFHITPAMSEVGPDFSPTAYDALQSTSISSDADASNPICSESTIAEPAVPSPPACTKPACPKTSGSGPLG